MKNIFLILIVLLGVCPTIFGHGGEISNALALHNTLHRLESLVAANKIDRSFLLNFKNISVENLAPPVDTDPHYRSTVFQYPGADGTANRLEVLLDKKAKPKKDTVTVGAPAQGAPVWPDKNSITLAELANHYIQEASEADPKLEKFEEKIKGMVLYQQADQGKIMAVADFSSAVSSETFRVILTPDGKVTSGNFVTNFEE